jgi:hypothetical protein
MSDVLTATELCRLVQRVFSPGPADRGLAIMVDLPDDRLPDHRDWARRRELAVAWAAALTNEREALGLDRVTLAWYPNVGGNNADLPPACVPGSPGFAPQHAADLVGAPSLPFAELFTTHSLILAPTELSTTAPLKVAARTGGFRAATMPGFLPSMVPALRLDYVEINRRVHLLKDLCDRAERAVVLTAASGHAYELILDLRHRAAHASGGLFPDNGVAGNLPSGEAYIVPYEGERPHDASRTSGSLPLQLGDELCVLGIVANRVAKVRGDGPLAAAEAEHFRREPAYANVAEFGLGVLGDLGVHPCGSILLDEKLGLHVAFGRSDHFGGIVGPSDFSSPDAVIHLDRVYIPETQPLVTVVEVRLESPQHRDVIMQNGRFTSILA